MTLQHHQTRFPKLTPMTSLMTSSGIWNPPRTAQLKVYVYVTGLTYYPKTECRTHPVWRNLKFTFTSPIRTHQKPSTCFATMNNHIRSTILTTTTLSLLTLSDWTNNNQPHTTSTLMLQPIFLLWTTWRWVSTCKWTMIKRVSLDDDQSQTLPLSNQLTSFHICCL